MYKICKTSKSEARQVEFQNTLLKLLKKQKMKEITIVSLCQEMGISRKTFYQYFDTIEDVLYAIIDKELQSGFLLLEVDPEIDRFFEFWKKDKWLLDILQKNEMSQLLVDRSYNSMHMTLEGISGMELMKRSGWISAIFTVVILWHHGGMQQSVEEMQELIYEMFHINSDILNKKR